MGQPRRRPKCFGGVPSAFQARLAFAAQVSTALAAAPSLAARPAVVQALRIVAAFGRGDAPSLRRALAAAPPLAAACCLALLPAARSALLRQLHAASNGREALPLEWAARLLWLPSAEAAAAAAAAHGVAAEQGGLRLKQPGFTMRPETTLPPLPPPELARWYERGEGVGAALLRASSGFALPVARERAMPQTSRARASTRV